MKIELFKLIYRNFNKLNCLALEAARWLVLKSLTIMIIFEMDRGGGQRAIKIITMHGQHRSGKGTAGAADATRSQFRTDARNFPFIFIFQFAQLNQI